MKPLKHYSSASLLALMILAANPSYAQENKPTTTPQIHSETTQSVQPGINQTVHDKIAKKQSEVFQEAIDAIAETHTALAALSTPKPNTKKALEALEKATGKLEIILARSPELMFAPVDISIKTHDLLASPETIKALIYDAEKYLDDGEVQKARLILANLVSEIEISTTALPLATYPAATKTAAAFIDDGNIKEAKSVLQSQLDTLVVSKEIIPLPILRAVLLLEKADILVQNSQRNNVENNELTILFDAARIQLNMAKLLGYGQQEIYQAIHQKIDDLEAKSAEGKSGQGWFETLKQNMLELF